MDEVEDWLVDFCTAKGIKYRPLEESPEGREILILIEQRKADREKALQKPKYFTIWQTPLIGRDEIIEEILTKLQKEGIRFLTLVGIPGVGKTELALQIEELAQKQEHFTNVKFFYLEAVTKVDVLWDEINTYLQSIDTQKRTLLILDNCEQIIELRKQLLKLRSEYEQLTILTTSRVEFSKEELEIETLQTPAAIQLFYDVAHRQDHSFELTKQNTKAIASICQYYEGLPIAIALAASWVKKLGVTGVKMQILQGKFLKQEDAYEDSKRHKSLYNLIEASYWLLEENEQRIFRRLKIFGNNGCSIKTAQRVCNLEEMDDAAFLNTLQVLAAHHFITFQQNRVQIAHQTLRDYALQKVYETRTESDRLERRYVDYFYPLVQFDSVVFDSVEKHSERSWWAIVVKKQSKRSWWAVTEDLSREFEYFGYYPRDTYEEELRGEITRDIIFHIDKMLCLIDIFQFDYLIKNGDKLIGKLLSQEEYQVIKRVVNCESYGDFSFNSAILQAQECYHRVADKFPKEDSNWPYPKCIPCGKFMDLFFSEQKFDWFRKNTKWGIQLYGEQGSFFDDYEKSLFSIGVTTEWSWRASGIVDH